MPKGPISQIMPQVPVTRHGSHDCVIAALAVALDIPYNECLEYVGANYTAGVGTIHCVSLMRALGFRILHVGYYSRITLRELVKSGQLAKGRFIVHIRSHVFAVIDGVAHDNDIYRRSPYVDYIAIIPE